ncbi:DUF1707 domain-containing protein [Allosaccharopolyspora coralli]|uniref:DUF1707 domain-containing protein n=1 Tax=Allosaccharopolyspora coralli TaxID=2665642 RepID=A0A5Q3QAD4_9PSEU|nr:DUF1707 domain-containing protein [Allosaccharopolyspora coralli]QGK71343.1 DUF1707 domain-containing protein [Allosaccharopolyspora coralli]
MPRRPGDGDDLRIGDPEREHVIALLGEHLGARRLEVHEYDERCRVAAQARLRSELTALFADLPDPRPVLATTAEPAPAARPGGTALAVGLGVALLALAVVTRQLWLLGIFAVAIALWLARSR